jgi:hypothetical protein
VTRAWNVSADVQAGRVARHPLRLGTMRQPFKPVGKMNPQGSLRTLGAMSYCCLSRLL